jgi:hypothetical protein
MRSYFYFQNCHCQRDLKGVPEGDPKEDSKGDPKGDSKGI